MGESVLLWGAAATQVEAGVARTPSGTTACEVKSVEYLDPKARSPSILFEARVPGTVPPYIDLELRIDPEDWTYDYSKLYYAVRPDDAFDESFVTCFKLRRRGQFERIRLRLPDAARETGYLRFRLDALAYVPGAVEARAVRLVDGTQEVELTRVAELLACKEHVRHEVRLSERERRTVLPHYPESLGLELTTRCNLTCTHCSSHGDAAEHRENNRRTAFDPAMLERLAHEIFPYLTEVNLVGRGEPTMVPQPLWDTLTRLLEHYRVLMTCVTNGLFLGRRFTASVLPLVDTVVVSIDGTTEDVFAANRGGASLARVLDNLAAFHALRQSLSLARRPRLGFSWTLKRNNIHQFADFVRMVLAFDPSLLYGRHLLVFRNKDRSQSLIGEPDLVNPLLRQAYALLEGTQVRLDVPPLMAAKFTSK